MLFFWMFLISWVRIWDYEVKLFQTKELEKGEIRLKDNNHRSGQKVFIPMNVKTFRRNRVTEEFCREPTIPLGHICWVIVVCLQGAGWERKINNYNLYLLGIDMKRRSHLARIDGTQSNKHLYNNNSNKIKNEDHVFIKKRSTTVHKNTNIKSWFLVKYKRNMWHEQAMKSNNRIQYILCHDIWRMNR